MSNKEEFDKIKQALKTIIDALYNQTLLNKMGLAAIRLIKKRTREGKDIEGKAFKGGEGYSKGWERIRKKKHLPIDIINLEFNDIDGMLQKIDHVVFDDYSKVVIGISDEEKEKIAYYLSVSGAGKNRIKFPFWGLSDEEKARVIELVKDELELTIEELSE